MYKKTQFEKVNWSRAWYDFEEFNAKQDNTIRRMKSILGTGNLY